MIFELKQKKNKSLEKAYKKSMKELNNFYGINWIWSTPRIFILNSRKDIDAVKGKKSERWVTGWADYCGNIFILDRLKIKTESSHKKGYSKEEYEALIKHELSHMFTRITTKRGYTPTWLEEGLAIYTSGQIRFRIEPKKFSQFLSFYKKHKEKGEDVYRESGFFILMLVKKFGKEKLIIFLKSLEKIKNKKEFDALFFKTYKFKLNYSEINRVYKK